MNSKSLNILLLEDEGSHALLISRALNIANCNVYWVKNNVDAINLLSKSEIKCDAIITDFKLMGEDSVELSLRLQKDPSLKKYKDIYTILCTCFRMSELEDYSNYSKLRFDDYVFKGDSNYTKEIINKLNKKLNILDDRNTLKIIEKEEKEDTASVPYSYFPVIESELVALDMNLTYDGISSFKISFSKPNKLPYIKMFFDLLPIAKVETMFPKFNQEQKAEIVGISRIKYSRLLADFHKPENSEIREVIHKFLKKGEN